jgi:hypothetical protein
MQGAEQFLAAQAAIGHFSRPGRPVVTAVLFGGFIIVPPLLSVYNYGNRILRAQRLSSIPRRDQINRWRRSSLYFPGSIIIVSLFFHFSCVTKHQNIAMRAAGGLPYGGEIATSSAA